MSFKEEHRRTRNIIKSFESQALKRRRWEFKLADNLTSFFGSIYFVAINAVYITTMLVINTGQISSVAIFDPYPFVFLATTLTIEAIFLMIIVLMSQIRQNQTSTLRSELQLQVSLISEKELTKVLKLIRMVLRKQGVEIKNDLELEAMIDEIDASYIERQLEHDIIPENKSVGEKIKEKISNGSK